MKINSTPNQFHIWEKNVKSNKSIFWKKEITHSVVRLVKQMREKIPAYKKFLQRANYTTLENIPATTKTNYFSKFSESERVWPQAQKKGMVLTSTSGSTGAPTYFVRDERLEIQYSYILELFLRHRAVKKTLVIDCFGMGVWIGGLITYAAFQRIGERGYPLQIITPGISKKDIFNALNSLAKNFEQVIITGYPPFIKDIISDKQFPVFDQNKTAIRFIFAAESFTEGFRNYLKEKIGVKNPFLDTMNIYGTAELGAMAFETPTSILVRKTILQNHELRDLLFPNGRIPTVAQFDPRFTAITEREGRLLLTGNNAQPFAHYDIGDNGNVFDYDKLDSILKNKGVHINEAANKNKIKITELPIVFIFERADFSTTFYGLQIYPQHIKLSLEPLVYRNLLTGKFTFERKLNALQNQYLEINVELSNGTKNSAYLKKQVEKVIIELLPKVNSEFRELAKHVPARRLRPKVKLWPHGHEKHFKLGIKQKWIHA